MGDGCQSYGVTGEAAGIIGATSDDSRSDRASACARIVQRSQETFIVARVACSTLRSCGNVDRVFDEYLKGSQ